MAAIFTFDYDFPTTRRSRRGTLSSISSISSRDDPVTPSIYSPSYADIMEISTDDCQRVYPVSTTFGQMSVYEVETPVTGAAGPLAESVYDVVIEEPETPVKPTAPKKAFFPSSLIVEEDDIYEIEIEDEEEEIIEFSLPSPSPFQTRPFRRSSISSVASGRIGGLSKMIAVEEMSSRSTSDAEEEVPAPAKDKKRRNRWSQKAMESSNSTSDDEAPFPSFKFEFKFEKRPVSSYSCSPATSNPGSDDEFIRARSCSPSPFRQASGLGALLNSRSAKSSNEFLKVATNPVKHRMQTFPVTNDKTWDDQKIFGGFSYLAQW